MQGGTVEHATVLASVRDVTKGWSYTALSRARGQTHLHIDASDMKVALERSELGGADPREPSDRESTTTTRAPREPSRRCLTTTAGGVARTQLLTSPPETAQAPKRECPLALPYDLVVR